METLTFVPNISMVADNFFWIEIEVKVKGNIIFFSTELEIDSLLFIFNTKQNIFIIKWK